MTNKTYNLGGMFEVNRIGYGAMRLTGQPRNFGPYKDWDQGIALLQRAADLGVNFFDSAWAYGPEHCDRLLGEALGDNPKAIIATKGGVDKTESSITVDGSPETLQQQITKSRQNLNRNKIDLFQLHRPDPQTPIEESVAALHTAKEAGHISLIGLCNVSLEEVQRAMSITTIASVQNKFNMNDDTDKELVAFTAEHNIAYIPYGPLDANPMEQGAKLNPSEALKWLLEYSPNIVVIPGTTSIAHLEENWNTWELL